MTNEARDFTSPVGRVVSGSTHRRREKRDKAGNPIRDEKGEIVTEISFGVAFPKIGPYGQNGQMVQTNHFSQVGEKFGAVLYAVGQAAHPMASQRPDFSWKMTDGDSTIPNKKGNIPNQQEGYAGHWVFWFTTLLGAPVAYDARGDKKIDPEQIKPGHYIQVAGNTKGNTGDSPGIYLNPTMVAHSGYGVEIVGSGPDVASAGFGQSPLPAGASTVPVGGFAAPAPAAAQPAPVPAAAVPAPVAAPVAAPTPVIAQPSFLAPQAPVAPPAAPVAPPAAPAGPQMTAKAGTFTYAQYIAQGWNDQQLRDNGMMV